jgi:hypothetical protein
MVRAAPPQKKALAKTMVKKELGKLKVEVEEVVTAYTIKTSL